MRARSHRVAGSALTLAALAAQGCSMARLESMVGVRAAVAGEAVVRRADGAQTVLRPQACLSGDRANFRGVDLLSPPYVLRVAADPLEGLGVAVIATDGGERLVFRASSCAVLTGDVQRTGWRVNDVRDVSGYFEVDCRLPSGEGLIGKVTFEHCH